MEQKNRNIWLFILPGIIGIGIFYVIPFILSLFYTFTTGIVNIEFVGLRNFVDLFDNLAFKLAIHNTLILLCVGVPLVVIISFTLSFAMSKKLYAFPRWAMLSSMIVPTASALMGWQAIFGFEGWLNKGLLFLNVKPHDFFTGPYAMYTLIFIFVVKNVGYMTVILTGALSTIGKELEEAFSLDSGSSMKFALKVVIPLISPIIFFVVLLSIVNSFQLFREIFALYGNYPPNSVYVLQHFMNNNFYKLNYQRLTTAAFVVITALSILISVFLKHQNRHLKG